MKNEFSTDTECALKLDRGHALSRFRERFNIPPGTIYMVGNSLGLQSKDSEKALIRVADEWKKLGIRGWLEAEKAWFHYAEQLGAGASELVGASPEEVIATGSTTVNIHSLVSTFYRPEGKRMKLLADALTFPTDIYALEGQVGLKGLDPEKDLLLVHSDDGHTLDEEKIAAEMTDEICVALLPSVLYRSGQLLDMEYLVTKAHEKDIFIGFDCSHSVGVVPHEFDAWNADFAMWCAYKYMNGGPGCSAFAYVNSRHFDKKPAMPGWFGFVKNRQFEMSLDFEHEKSAGGWQISSPCILGAAPIEGSLDILLEAGIDRIREQSLSLTSYLMFLVDSLLSDEPYGFGIVTPRQDSKRGGHVAIQRKSDASRICHALHDEGVICDFRPPDILRIAPCALYNTFNDVYETVMTIKNVIDTKKFEQLEDRGPCLT